MRHSIFVGLFLLYGCSDNPRMWRESEIREIAEDYADASSGDETTIDSAAQVAELQNEIEQLKEENARMLRVLADMSTDEKWQSDSFDRLFKNDETLRQNLNTLLTRSGQAPIPRVD